MSPGPARSYDRDRVLDRVMLVFWSQGYEATSVRELREATGLGSRSLYDDFGNKRALFRAALDRYRERSILPLYEPLREGDSPLAALHAFVDRFASMAPDDQRLGCLVGVGMGEVRPTDDDELAAEVAALAEEMRTRVAEAIAAAVARGEVEASASPTEAAALLTAALQGAHLAGRIQPGGSLRADTLAGAHHLLDRMAVSEEER